MFSKSEVGSNSRNCQAILWSVYELACPLAADQPFDMCKENRTSWIYLGMSPIHASLVALVLRFSTGRLSLQFRVVFDPSFTTINCCDVNIVPPSYWQAMYGVLKGKKLVFVNSEKIIHQLHSLIHNIKVVLPVRIPRNQKNKQKHQWRNMITSNHQCSNPHQSSNQWYSLQLLKNTQRLSSRGE